MLLCPITMMVHKILMVHKTRTKVVPIITKHPQERVMQVSLPILMKLVQLMARPTEWECLKLLLKRKESGFIGLFRL